MLPSLISVFMDYWCNYSCGHCSVGSSPTTKMKMPDDIFDKLFEDLAPLKSAKVVVFTGGEPTLHPDMLERGIRRATDLGLRTRVVSNGWWAKSPSKATKYLKKLQDAGLDEINTSFDDYHVPLTDVSKIINVIKAGNDLGMPVGVGVIREKTATWGDVQVKQAIADGLGVEVEGLGKCVTIVTDAPTPSGTGESIDVSGYDAGDKLNLGCTEVLKTVSIHPTGAVKACCGHVMFQSKDLTLGSIKTEPLVTILERAQKNVFYWLIHMMGPKRLLEEIGVESTYSSQCHACQVLLTQHRAEFMDYIVSQKERVFRDNVLLSDNLKNMVDYALEQRPRVQAYAFPNA